MVSLWQAISKAPKSYPKLEKELEVDVVVIGGGITGITAAHQLVCRGKTVAVVEAHTIGGVTTSSSTGNLYLAVQPLYQSIEKKWGFEVAKTVLHARKLAIDYIEGQITEKKIDCHFKRRPWYGYSTESNDQLRKECELLKKMGADVELINSLPLNIPFQQALIMPQQARFNPMQYVIDLAQDLDKKGCYIFEHSPVLSLEEKTHCEVITKQGKINAAKIFIATHTPIGINVIQTFTAPYRSYVVAVTLKDQDYPEGHFWDFDKSPASLSTHATSKEEPALLLAAGSHHKTGQGVPTQAHTKELSYFLRKHFAVDDIAYQWSAQHYQSADNLPYVGLAYHGAKHTYMATGYFADGLVYGTLAGLMIGDILSHHKNEFQDIFNTDRHDILKSLPFWIRENSNVLLQYIKDIPILKNPEFKNLKKGEGIIVEQNRCKYALCRDENNTLHAVSAVCPHMKCIVQWNNAEQTWDCPCHGSRFMPSGEVIEGPAMQALFPLEIDKLNKED